MKKLFLGLLATVFTLSIYSCRETTEEKTEDAVEAIGEDMEAAGEEAEAEMEEVGEEIEQAGEEAEAEIKEEIDEEIHETDDAQ